MNIMAKFINRLILLRDFYLRRKRAASLPMEIVIEVTNKCNLNCIMCTRQNMTRKIGFMEMKLYKKIVDEVAGYLELLYLHGLGEPLFHPKIFEMVKYAKDKGLNVGISTNATLLTKEKSKRLIDSGLDYLIIALDAATPKTFEKVRGGKNFKKVVANVKDYLKLKKRTKSSPFTVIQFVKLDENEKEVKRFLKMWQDSGADVVRVKPVINLLREHKKTGKLPRRPCFYIWRQLNMVSWDGKVVTPCCMDSDGDYPLSDANKDSIKQIWNNRKMMALRKAHATGKWQQLSLCRDCTYPQPSFPGKLGAMIFSDMMVKKILPYLERISLGRFHVYD